jgi:hypothetical protein
MMAVKSEVSAYAALSRHWSRSPASSAEIREALADCAKPACTVFDLSTHALQRLGVGGPAGQVSAINPGSVREAWVQHELRYCATCLSKGWHAPLFQHLALHMCPVHVEAMRTGCARCRQPIKVDLLGVGRSPFCCDHCGTVLVATIDATPGAPSSSFDRMRALLSIDADAHWTNAGVIRSARGLGAPAIVANVVRRFASWPKESATDVRDRAVNLWFDGSHADLVAVDTDAEVGTFLESFRQVLCQHGIDTSTAQLRCTSGSVLVRYGSEIAVGTAVLVLVGRFYAGHPLSQPRRWPSQAWEVKQKGEASASPISAVVRAELWDLTARLLVRQARGGGQTAHDWTVDIPPEHEYVVPVRLKALAGRFEVSFKPRAGAALVSRLLRRYGHRVLSAPCSGTGSDTSSRARPGLVEVR